MQREGIEMEGTVIREEIGNWIEKGGGKETDGMVVALTEEGSGMIAQGREIYVMTKEWEGVREGWGGTEIGAGRWMVT